MASCKAPIAAACQLWMDMSSNFGTVSRISSGSTSFFFVICSHSSTTIHVSIECTSLKYMKKYMYICTLSVFTLNCNEFYMHGQKYIPCYQCFWNGQFCPFFSFLISIRALTSHFIGFLAFLFFPETKSGLPSLFDLQAMTCKGGGCTLSAIFKFTIFSILWIYLNSSVHFKKTENRKMNFKSTDLILFQCNLWGTLWCCFQWCSLF